VAEHPLVHRQDVTAAVAPDLAANAAAAGSDAGLDAEIILPSILPDEFADNHAVELDICMRWFSSDAGKWRRSKRRWGTRMCGRTRCFIAIICGSSRRRLRPPRHPVRLRDVWLGLDGKRKI
jgi:hypothetical protein